MKEDGRYHTNVGFRLSVLVFGNGNGEWGNGCGWGRGERGKGKKKGKHKKEHHTGHIHGVHGRVSTPACTNKRKYRQETKE